MKKAEAGMASLSPNFRIGFFISQKMTAGSRQTARRREDGDGIVVCTDIAFGRASLLLSLFSAPPPYRTLTASAPHSPRSNGASSEDLETLISRLLGLYLTDRVDRYDVWPSVGVLPFFLSSQIWQRTRVRLLVGAEEKPSCLKDISCFVSTARDHISSDLTHFVSIHVSPRHVLRRTTQPTFCSLPEIFPLPDFPLPFSRPASDAPVIFCPTHRAHHFRRTRREWQSISIWQDDGRVKLLVGWRGKGKKNSLKTFFFFFSPLQLRIRRPQQEVLLSPAVHFFQLLRNRHPQRDSRNLCRVQQALQAVEGGQVRRRRRRGSSLGNRQDAGVLVAR